MRALSLFSGIGGLDIAAEAALGAQIAATCEINAYCRDVLRRHWPAARQFSDVQALSAGDVGAVDLVIGGFPCTDLSLAGKRAGLEGERSGLWREYLRLIGDLRPALVAIENVPPLMRDLGLRRQIDEPLQALGYRVLWTICAASDVGAPHRRERCFALAVADGADVPPAPRQRAAEFAGWLWPTPAAGNFNESEDLQSFADRRERLRAKHGNSNGCGVPLGVAVRLWGTPRTSDYKDAGPVGSKSYLCAQAKTGSSVLNPEWVELLMGLPMGWTLPHGPAMQASVCPQWPAGQGPHQHGFEPPRGTVHERGSWRRERIMALGNAVVPAQAMLALSRLAASANDGRLCASGSDQMRLF